MRAAQSTALFRGMVSRRHSMMPSVVPLVVHAVNVLVCERERCASSVFGGCSTVCLRCCRAGRQKEACHWQALPWLQSWRSHRNCCFDVCLLFASLACVVFAWVHSRA